MLFCTVKESNPTYFQSYRRIITWDILYFVFELHVCMSSHGQSENTMVVNILLPWWITMKSMGLFTKRRMSGSTTSAVQLLFFTLTKGTMYIWEPETEVECQTETCLWRVTHGEERLFLVGKSISCLHLKLRARVSSTIFICHWIK